MAKKIAVVGMGYVGIPCAALLADVDEFEVIGVQRRSKRSGWKIDYINQGKCPIGGDEPGLADLIANVVKRKKFEVTDDISVCQDADVILIDVQTPTDENNVPHYESLRSVSQSIGKYMKPKTLVVIESTVAPGTTENLVKPILEEMSGLKAGEDFYLAFSFERVRPGRLVRNIVHLPRIVGGINEKSSQMALEIYSKIVKEKIYVTDCLTAETTKCVENAYRDINVAYANEVALLCERLGINAYEVRELTNTLPNVDVHVPGAGVGGHCLPKDTWLLLYGVEKYGKPENGKIQILTKAREMNNFMPVHMAKLLETAMAEAEKTIAGSKITVLGFSFLENTDDTRNTPALSLIKILEKKGAQVIVHDPFVREFEEVNLTDDLEGAINGSDALVLVTRHRQYFDLKPEEVKALARTPVIVDGRNVFDLPLFNDKGFITKSVGKGFL
jgi:UDP-N-acetyl-D-mannosaminuronic acid dehydrogenase